MTIRRDLDRMGEQGLLNRTYGGASVSTSSLDLMVVTNSILQEHAHEKDQIAQKAVNLINDDETVFLNNGSTVVRVIPHIKNKYVRIITNNSIAALIERDPIVEIIILGGECRYSSKAIVGEITLNNIESMNSSITFLGVNSIDPKTGIYTSSFQESVIAKKMIEKSSGKVVILADSTKVGKKASFLIDSISAVDILITDSKIDQKIVDEFQDLGIQVIVAQI